MNEPVIDLHDGFEEGPVEIYVTFGPDHAKKPEYDWIDPDGYLTVIAPSYWAARQTVFAVLGNRFAFDYQAPKDMSRYTKGELARITITLDVTQKSG